MAKRLELILAREAAGYTKKEVALGADIEEQRYRRIENNTAVMVDVDEAYRIARFLKQAHPALIFVPWAVEKINSDNPPNPAA
jgi:transcriptional regulator with XRE-family HTH domain